MQTLFFLVLLVAFVYLFIHLVPVLFTLFLVFLLIALGCGVFALLASFLFGGSKGS